MRLDNGRVIGGYSNLAWSSSGYGSSGSSYGSSSTAFLFSITNNYKHTLATGGSWNSCAIYSRGGYDPIFGYGGG
jgi:hypothetical protein